MLRKLCVDNKIDYITKDGHWLMCQIGTTINECPKVKGCYFGLPIHNYHSNSEIISFKCMENAIKLFECIGKE
jgi:putative aminopeptidase FrvX